MTKEQELIKEIKKADNRNYLGSYSEEDILKAELKGIQETKKEMIEKFESFIDYHNDCSDFSDKSCLKYIKEKLNKLKEEK